VEGVVVDEHVHEVPLFVEFFPVEIRELRPQVEVVEIVPVFLDDESVFGKSRDECFGRELQVSELREEFMKQTVPRESEREQKKPFALFLALDHVDRIASADTLYEYLFLKR